MDLRETSAWLQEVDWAQVARAASTGFTVLLIVGLGYPLIAGVSPVGALIWLVVGAVSGFAVAGWRAGTGRAPAVSGAIAGGFGYLLTVPLTYFAGDSVEGMQVILTFLAATVVGATAGYLPGNAARRRSTGQ